MRELAAGIVDAMHAELLRMHGGAPGLRDRNGLESALARPGNVAAYEPDADMARLASVLMHGIAKNHPYVDGNERVALAVTATFLRLNGWSLEATEPEVVAVTLGVAAGAISELAAADWIRAHLERIDLEPAPAVGDAG